jgi:glycosyltransferase involved in cell wall biosynthesis
MKGMSEFVKNGYNGFTFKKDDASQLGLIMQKIVDNPATLLQLSKNADYNKGIMDHAENVLDIYLAVLRNTENG